MHDDALPDLTLSQIRARLQIHIGKKEYGVVDELLDREDLCELFAVKLLRANGMRDAVNKLIGGFSPIDDTVPSWETAVADRLGVRTANALFDNFGVRTIGDLLYVRQDALEKISGIGRKTIQAVIDAARDAVAKRSAAAKKAAAKRKAAANGKPTRQTPVPIASSVRGKPSVRRASLRSAS